MENPYFQDIEPWYERIRSERRGRRLTEAINWGLMILLAVLFIWAMYRGDFISTRVVPVYAGPQIPINFTVLP